MLGITDLKTNTKIELDGDPYVVTDYQHAKMGRGGAVVRTKLRNLRTGSMLQKTFQGSDKIKPANLSSRKGQYLYGEGDSFTFMDTQNYEQFTLDSGVVGDGAKFLKEGLEVSLLQHGDAVIAVELPIKVEYEVKDTDPGLKGDTVSGGSKPATVESGATVTVPLFVQIGDRIRVDTRTGTYLERA
jgi:elongation factor P